MFDTLVEGLTGQRLSKRKLCRIQFRAVVSVAHLINAQLVQNYRSTTRGLNGDVVNLQPFCGSLIAALMVSALTNRPRTSRS